MTLEQLKAAGLSDEQAKAVLKIHQDSINGNYVPKATFDAERDKVKTANDTIAERDKQITELGKFKGTAEELEKKVTDLEAENKTANEKYQADLLKSQNEAAMHLALTGKVVDADDVIPKLDVTKVVFKDGKIVSGFEEQLTELKKTKPHYFTEEKKPDDKGVPGWIFGKTPAEGSGEQKPGENKDADFGKQLASFKTTAESTAKKAEEIYFK